MTKKYFGIYDIDLKEIKIILNFLQKILSLHMKWKNTKKILDIEIQRRPMQIKYVIKRVLNTYATYLIGILSL